MEAFATSLMLIAGAAWVGAIVFQAAIVAPAVFVALDVESARRFLRTLFPRFYRFGLVCGVLMVAGLITLGLTGGWTGRLTSIAALTAIMLVLQIASLKLVPRINAARDAGEAAAMRFHRLHRLSVGFTVLIMLLGTIALAIIGASAASSLVA